MDDLEYLVASKDLEKYVGVWVAIIGREVVAHGKSLKKVLAITKERYPGKEPFVAKLPKNGSILL